MIDIKLLRAQPEVIKKWCTNKFVSVDVDAIIELDSRVRGLKQQMDDLNAQRNIAAANRDIEKGKAIKVTISEIENHYKQLEDELYIAMKQLPNGYSDDTPIGKDDSENIIIKKRGTPRSYDFEPKDQEDLLLGLGCFDKERAVKISGSRFVYLFGDIVLLQQAIISWTYATLTNQEIINQIIKDRNLEGVSNKVFTPALPPIIMKRDMMDRMGRYNPNDTTYELKMDDMVLIASAEHSLGPIFADEMLKEAELPIRYLGFSPAFRREAGSYGKDMKGTFRLHQFDKLELETFTTPEQGMKEHQFLVAVQEYLMQQLELPYELMICCTGDMGTPDYRHMDINTWLPSQGKYRETHSADYMTDFQSRRLNTRVKLSTGENVFVHMNDATAFAMCRTLVAICENYQNQDGTITIPQVLRQYMGGKTTI